MLSQRNTPNQNQPRRTVGRRATSRGFSMLETLVTLLIIAIWLLGSAGVQTIAMKLNKSSAMRNQAILLASEIGERMENNRSAAAAGKYAIKKMVKPSKWDCVSASCTPDQLAQHDLADVTQRAGDNFDLEILTVAGKPTDPTLTYTIEVSWLDRKGNQTYATNADETGSYLSRKTIYRPVAAKGKGP